MADLAVEGIKTAAERLDIIVLAGATLSGVVIALRATGKEEFEFKGVSLNVENYWMVCILLTISHGYFAYVFVDRVDMLLRGKPNFAKEAWETVSVNGPIIMQGLRERSAIGTIELPFGHRFVLYDMNHLDPTTLLAVAFIILLFISLLPKLRQIGWDNPTIWLAPTFVPFLNWSIGSYWAIGAMQLVN